MIKLYLLIFISILIIYVGNGFGKYYRDRNLFYVVFMEELVKLKSNINFEKTMLYDYFCKVSTRSCYVNILFESYLSYLENNTKILDILILDKNENEKIKAILIGLGSRDACSEIDRLNEEMESIKIVYGDIKKQTEQFAPICLKLSILLAFCVVILAL